ncbi:hypothetical protein [Vagococcus acidifermentans]|uniref:hypothetical protein n=1 Tax=Vagococcus acidifermentans TaxID=564710 RepID=UPI000F89A899|nr:hypothetical protein [Vagococcus acidifermentans]
MNREQLLLYIQPHLCGHFSVRIPPQPILFLTPRRFKACILPVTAAVNYPESKNKLLALVNDIEFTIY